MGRFLARRLGLFLLTLWAVITVSFVLIHSVKGGPFDEERAIHPAARAQIEEAYHLNWPLWKQYLQYLGPLNLDSHGWFGDGRQIFSGVLAFDLGPSLRMRDFTVNQIIGQALPKSALIGLLALFFALILGVTTGCVSAWKKDSWVDHGAMTLASLGLGVPNYVFASLLILVFSFAFPWFPAAGWGSFKNMVLPSFALSLPFAASVARLMRTGMIETLNQDFMKLARAKGLGSMQMIQRHALRGALIPVLSYLGPATAGILTGSLVIEKIFAIPGLGTHFVQSALNRDYTLAMGITILYTCLVYSLNCIVDLCYRILDPRVKLS